MVAVNRLTGHSPGFFSVYTLPPNQAVSVEVQRKINANRQQTPTKRDVRALILGKTRSLLTDCQRWVFRGVGVDQFPGLYEDGELLGCHQQPEGYQHESDRVATPALKIIAGTILGGRG